VRGCLLHGAHQAIFLFVDRQGYVPNAFLHCLHQVRGGVLGFLDEPPQFRHGPRVDRRLSSFQLPIDPAEDEDDGKTSTTSAATDGKKIWGLMSVIVIKRRRFDEVLDDGRSLIAYRLFKTQEGIFYRPDPHGGAPRQG
jgi:hypothetical protein